MNCYSVSPHSFFCYGFFQNYFSILFFNIELVDNYNCGFSHKTLWIATVFPHMFFFLFFMNFSKILFFDFSFLISSWLRIQLCYFFSLKRCGLLRCFLTRLFFHFFMFSFLYDFFQNCLCRFYFLNIELIKNLVL